MPEYEVTVSFHALDDEHAIDIADEIEEAFDPWIIDGVNSRPGVSGDVRRVVPDPREPEEQVD